MCWICAADAKATLAQNFWGAKNEAAGLHVQAATLIGDYFAATDIGITDFLPAYKASTTAFVADGVGDLKPLTTQNVLILTPDEAPGTIATTRVLNVDAAPVVATINTPGDLDFFKVELIAGTTYEIGQYAKVGGPSGIPLADAYIELYDAAGNLVTTADGGGPNTPSGLDALLAFTAETSGTYYINARSFDNAPEDGSNGEFVGDYELFVREAAADAYKPYYDVDSPLHAIDWGSQVDRT
ncbi:MAG: PPC domain-containing protein, partial [Pseudomonadota bacterium]|nr:PPC domain-containing protein [Pseudomonadota bacterium]